MRERSILASPSAS